MFSKLIVYKYCIILYINARVSIKVYMYRNKKCYIYIYIYIYEKCSI